MSVEHWIDLIGRFAWPLTLLGLALLFRRSLIGALRGGGELEGPGFKAKWFEDKMTKIISEGTKENATPEKIAERIAESIPMDTRELRILRGLVDEDSGRGMYSYQSSYYRPALQSLQTKGYIRTQDKKYVLTPAGRELARGYLSRVLGLNESEGGSGIS